MTFNFMTAQPAFFDNDVQKVLETCPIVGSEQEQLAWPIRVFYAVDELANGGHKWEAGEDFISCYMVDHCFCANMLQVVTRYYERRQNQLTLQEVAMDILYFHEDRIDIRRKMRGEPTRIIPKVKWDAIACTIWERHKIQVTGNTLKSRVSKYRKDWNKVVARWRDNLYAYHNHRHEIGC